MSKFWKWTIGITLTILLASLFTLILLLSNGGYGMMGYGHNWHLPMMYAGFGMILIWPVTIVILLLIGIGIIWMINSSKTLK